MTSLVENTAPLDVLVFVKAPIPGRCKTRLARHLGPRLAARCYRAMTEHVVAQLAARSDLIVTLCCAPNTHHPFFARLARRYGVKAIRQSRGSLGQRMQQAMRSTAPRSALVIGSDQPDLSGNAVAIAREALARNEAVIAPTVDGGYWLIGLPRADSQAFVGIAWSTLRVARHTRTAFRRLGLTWREPAKKGDIDTIRDWQALPSALRCALLESAVCPGAAGVLQRAAGNER